MGRFGIGQQMTDPAFQAIDLGDDVGGAFPGFRGRALSWASSAEERIAARGLRRPWATADPISPTTARFALHQLVVLGLDDALRPADDPEQGDVEKCPGRRRLQPDQPDPDADRL